MLPHKSIFCVEKIAGRNFRISIDLMYFTFHCNQFWLVSAIEFDYLCFSFGKAVIAGLLRLFTIIPSIPKINKIIHSNFKFENTHILASNIIVNMLGRNKWINVPRYVIDYYWRNKLNNRLFQCFILSN